MREHLTDAGQELAYIYDFGDDWWHTVTLEAISRPSHREHRAMLEWCGGAFDPEAFVAGDVVSGKRGARGKGPGR